MTNNNKQFTRKNCKFTKKDFDTNIGMLTYIWGPTMWTFLHTMSFNYPIKPTLNDQKYYKEFILCLQTVLPCSHCRNNLIKHIEKFPLTNNVMKNRTSFSKYIYNLHELVNK